VTSLAGARDGIAAPPELSTDRVLSIVSRAGLFQGVATDAVQAITQCLTYRAIDRGDPVYSEGEPGNELYIVVDGKAKVSRRAVDGRETVLAVMGPSDMFGELSLFDPGPRTATASAMTPLSVGTLSNASLRPWIADRPEIALQLMRVIARRLRRTNDARSDLIFTDVPARVAKQLLDFATRFGVATPEGVLVHHDLNQVELAQMVGASRETLNKVLSDFASRGWIRTGRHTLTILDSPKLTRRARPTVNASMGPAGIRQRGEPTRHSEL
jgi:CRP/FNR family cyclic AMP-dependent transcriptional regulator